MASPGDGKHTRIELKHVLMAVIVIVSTLSLIASIAMITIGYLNPFGTVGLGILGGGCVLYFGTILFLCSSGIWVKNRYFPEEKDFIDGGIRSYSEDLSLLKPPAKSEAGIINEAEGLSDKMVPLWSVSTVYSTVSSSASTVPETTMLWRDAEGDLDSDVFSSSFTAMQHTDMKLQEKFKLKQGSTEQTDCHPTSEWKIKDLEKKKFADAPILYNNGKSISDTPYQRKPVVMDFVGATYSSAEENSQIRGRNNILCPVEGPSSSAQFKHKYFHDLPQPRYKNNETNTYNQDCKPALEKRKVHPGEKGNQARGRYWSVISANDSWIHSPRFRDTSESLNTAPKHQSCDRLDKISQEESKVPVPNLLPNTWLDQSEKVQFPGQMTGQGMRKGF